MESAYVLLVLAAMMVVTFTLRALPFVASQWLKKYPVVQRLKDFLPLCIMSLLVLHAGADAARNHPLGIGSVLAGVALTVLLQWRIRHPLLSILSGTALFVALFYAAR